MFEYALEILKFLTLFGFGYCMGVLPVLKSKYKKIKSLRNEMQLTNILVKMEQN